MILRRLTKHVKDQNWFAVGLDFLIVVAGVFLGIQIGNWNAGRADDARATAYLERLSSDINTDLMNARRKLEFWSRVSDYGSRGLDYAETGHANGQSDWQLLLAYFQASQLDEFIVTDTTYQEMKSAGELSLIKDETLRETLGNYYALSGNYVLTERPRYREQVRGIIPLRMQSYIWTNCYATDAVGQQTMLDCEASFNAEDVKRVVETLSGDEALMAQLRYWISTLQIASIISQDSINSAQSASALIDSALSRGTP
tara:strand:+ start:519 stop:1289 length:771 start_codon:yes stop_codon:yes gene_type:complete